jgi:predicted Rossmann-fold nucleotide-binding protein
MIGMYHVLVTGSGELSPHLVEFTRALGRRIMMEEDLVLVTGGLRQRTPGVPTVDHEVVQGALEQLRILHDDPRQRILTLVPEQERDDRVRFREGEVRVVARTNRRARRYAMVRASDVIIAIEGHHVTRENIDLAWILGKPFLPVPCTGGHAGDAWERYGDEIRRTLHIGEQHAAVLESGLDDPNQLANCCTAVLRRVAMARCFIAMKFDEHPAHWAYGLIQDVARRKCYEPVRVDRVPGVGNIVDTIWTGIKASDIFIADISGNSPNVFYELGIAHALRKDVIILAFSPSEDVPDDIPFDIAPYRVIPYHDEDSLRAALERELPDRCRRSEAGFSGPMTQSE